MLDAQSGNTSSGATADVGVSDVVSGAALDATDAAARMNTADRGWEHMQGCATDIAAGGGNVYALACHDGGTSGAVIKLGTDGSWMPDSAGGTGVQIAIDQVSGRPWVIKDDGNVYESDGLGYVGHPGTCAKSLAVASGDVWAIACGPDDQAVKRLFNTVWVTVPGHASQISMGRLIDGAGITPWALQSSGSRDIYSSTGNGNWMAEGANGIWITDSFVAAIPGGIEGIWEWDYNAHTWGFAPNIRAAPGQGQALPVAPIKQIAHSVTDNPKELYAVDVEGNIYRSL
ncbi:MAG: hypothetical protein JWM95_3502 [Gemmatimonadetes bacterium]|nr:hypothetical protein [Gemmatimonadota bacterium]